ncbi:MAG: Rpn family recombination-promoting nuclease/putative transposase [Prevotella sp.]|nr:Rpn family recombination-promoting nuclease/putative transposase [Prevotella sp.]MBQ2495317.1 Rpn family recombination-promoting nuclease/putative transposase [Prevotella sp.]MBQ4174106.1 Rpn family recombination-promoting nuclease/putative transposase [Prevotella sp.]MBR6938010.1 Rpn family recombination-promoting nuclease/putative transposase [Prevotella sp.]
MGVFINPFTDIGFKRIFGQEFSKPLLLDFLNNLLVGERKIENITFLDKEMPRDIEGERSIIYDVLCETETGEKIIVEMQNQRQPFFKQRSIFYASEAISRQARKGREWRFDIKAVYLIAFLNFTLEDIGTTFRTDVALLDMRTKEVFSDKIRLIYLQLPYFNKEADECENDFERWIYVLKNMETINRLPWTAKSAVFKRLEEIAEVRALTKEEQMQYDHALKVYRDNYNTFQGAIEEGMKEGREKGRADKTKEVAQNMKKMGMSIEQIAQACGISVEEAEKL